MTKPVELKILNGSAARHKDRLPKKNVPKSTHPLGDPPKNFKPDEVLIWHEMLHNAPAGVLVCTDIHVVEMACKLVAKMRRDECTAPDYGRLLACLNTMGMTPSSRSNITLGEVKEETTFGEFGRAVGSSK